VTAAVPYAPGKSLDVHAPAGADGVPVVLLWHGSGVDERDVLAPLARELAGHGIVVVVPDWQSDDPVAGPAQLLASLAFTRREAAGSGGDVRRTVVAGWSLGANAVAWLALHPDLVDGWAPVAWVGLAGSYDESPFGDDLFAGVGSRPQELPALLIHGTGDTVVPVRRSQEAAERLRGPARSVRLCPVATDHAGVVGTEYDPWRRRCVATADPSRVAVRAEVAALIAALASGAGA
jgi:dienelactone hydrolase